MLTPHEFDPHAPIFHESINVKPELRQKFRDLNARLHAERIGNDSDAARLEPQTTEEIELADLAFTFQLVSNAIDRFGVEIVSHAVAKSIDPSVLLARLAEAVRKNES